MGFSWPWLVSVVSSLYFCLCPPFHSPLCCADISICVGIQESRLESWSKNKNNLPKKTLQLDQFASLIYTVHKNSVSGTAQSVVTVQDNPIAETFVFRLHPCIYSSFAMLLSFTFHVHDQRSKSLPAFIDMSICEKVTSYLMTLLKWLKSEQHKHIGVKAPKTWIYESKEHLLQLQHFNNLILIAQWASWVQDRLVAFW